MAKKSCDVFRENHKRLCDILHTSPSTLASFTIALYAKKIIDMKTKIEVLRIEGMKGADLLLNHVMLKLQSNPKRFRIVLETVLAEDALSDVGKEMESLHSRQNLTVCNRQIPIVEAPSTDAIRFAKQLKSVYEELVDVIFDSVKNVDVSNLRVRLNVFFMSDNHVRIDADNTLLSKLDSCKTTEDVLLCLIRANFIGYLNYKLLEVFAKASFSEQAFKLIDDYEKEYLKLFKCDFPSLIKLFRNPRLTAIPPVSLPEFTVRLGTTIDQSDLYSLKEFFENRFSWAEHLLILDVVENCILIKYGVLPFFVSAVARDLTDPAIIEELKKEDITIELSPQLKDIARHHDDQLALEVLPSLHDISSSDVSLFLRSHDLAITDTQKSQLQTMTAITHTDSHKDEFQVGTVVSEDSQSFAKAAAELEDLPMEKLITDWDEHGETNSSSGFHEDLQSLDVHIKADARLAEKVFVYEKALEQLLEERKSIGTKNEMHKKMMIELKEMHLTIDKLKNQNKALCEENELLKESRKEEAYSPVDSNGVRHQDYKVIANNLQRDLRIMTDKVTELGNTLDSELDKKNLKIASLISDIKVLEKRNTELHQENLLLEDENTIQALNYVKVRKELNAASRRSQGANIREGGGHRMNDIDHDDPEREKKLQDILTKNMVSFKRYTDMESLSSHLIQYQLLTNDELSHINSLSTSSQRAMHLYTSVLPSKGAKAYTTFYRCLRSVIDDGDCHIGHRDLLDILNTS